MDIFVEISLIIVIATVIAGLFRILKQPLIMSYIVTGLVVGPYILNLTKHPETIDTFSEMGIAILLFIVGLNLSPKAIKEVGKSAFIAGALQMLVTFGLAFTGAKAFHYPLISSLYIAAAFTFSSTIIVLKLLGDKKDLEKLYGRIAIGICLLQDVVAILVLIIASSFSSGSSAAATTLLLLVKGVAITGVLVGISIYLLPKLGDFFAKSQEYLFLFSLGWGFGVAILFERIGLSIEIGALLAGVALAMSPYNQEISAKLKPLRDFFIVMFFVFLGTRMELGSIGSLIIPAAVFIFLSLVIKPLIIIFSLGFLGYNRKTSFYAGISLAQISEFGMILALLGVNLAHLDTRTLSLITLVGLVTIGISSYFIIYADPIYKKMFRYLKFLQFKRPRTESDFLGYHDVVLFGCNRVGYDFIKVFRKLGQGFLAIDFDPDVVKELTEKGINCRYGDAEDPEFLDDISPEKAKIVVSTIPDYETNSYLLERIRKLSEEVNVILISYNLDESIKLYENGASYVLMPHFIGGQYAAELADKHGFKSGVLHKKRKEHLEYLKERKQLGHAHPMHNQHL
jgi:Kef-type K+ transport system membrane component KefB